MTDKQVERDALQLIGLLNSVVVYPDVVKRAAIRKPLLALADKALKGTDG
jgi:hypothetical protein